MSKSTTYLRYKGAVASAASRRCELYTAAADWAGAKTLKMVNASGVTLYAGLDPVNIKKHRSSLPSGAVDPKLLWCAPGFDNVFPNGNFASALSGWTAYSPLGTGFDITRVTDDQMLYPPASGLLTKAKTKQTGAYVEAAFTIAAADRAKRLYAQISTKVLDDYTDGLFKVQILSSGKVMTEQDIPAIHTTLQLTWMGDNTAVYTFRIKVNTDPDDNRVLDKERKLAIGNIYAGPNLQYRVARKLLVLYQDPAEVSTDRLNTPEVKLEAKKVHSDTHIPYEASSNFDYDAVFGHIETRDGSESDDGFNLLVSGLGLNKLYVDSILQTPFSEFFSLSDPFDVPVPLGGRTWALRLSGKHTIKITGYDKTTFHWIYALTQSEVK